MPIPIRTASEIALMRESGKRLAEVHHAMREMVRPGVSTAEINECAERKIAELGGLVSNEYTLEGKLIGHISIGHGWLMETAESLGLADAQETLLLRHMLLSHHGKNEFGSPVLPQIPEAEALYLIDYMDSRMVALRSALENVKPGQWSQKMFAFENRQFYKAGK